MVSFRRCILAIAILALFAGLASAQISGSQNPNLTCSVSVANPNAVRAEGHSELLGDIVLNCTGGTGFPASGAAITTANITVALGATQVSSRVFSNGLSEALLLIDEPGSSLPGAEPIQTPCATVSGISSVLVGAGFGGCQTFFNPTGSISGGAAAMTCTTFNTLGLCTAFSKLPNVFQGIVNNNQVVFNGIPILAPVTPGLSRVFRITNVRADANAIPGSLTFSGTTGISASITASTSLLINNPVQTAGFIFQGLQTGVIRNGNNSGGGSISVAQCATAGLTAGAVLRFTEGFANSFKTRIQPTSAISGAATNSNTLLVQSAFNQNIPNAIFNASESGFILPVGGGTAGLADFGTRLKATFTNVPTGMSLFVTTTNINPSGATNINANTGGNVLVNLLAATGIPSTSTTAISEIAALVTSETAPSGVGGFLPLQSVTNTTNQGTNLFGPLPVDANGTAVAVWEVLLDNPAQQESFDFGVFYTQASNPAANIPPTSPGGSVTFSFAPIAATGNPISTSAQIPRFASGQSAQAFIAVNLCQTTLLFPFVTFTPASSTDPTNRGLDTGIAISNTTNDEFGTRNQAGSCKLEFFQGPASSTNANIGQAPVDIVCPGATCPGGPSGTVIPAGTTMAIGLQGLVAQSSSPFGASAATNGFTGYMIAVCNFQLAHGYAQVSDVGLRNLAAGYLALVLPTGTNNRNNITESIAH